MMMKIKPGQYYYAPHHNMWGVWKAGCVTDGIQTDEFIEAFPLKSQARDFVYNKNGWKTKITN